MVAVVCDSRWEESQYFLSVMTEHKLKTSKQHVNILNLDLVFTPWKCNV